MTSLIEQARSLYEITGDVKDANTLLVNRADRADALQAAQCGGQGELPPLPEPVGNVESWTNGSYWRNYKLRWSSNHALDAGETLYSSSQMQAFARAALAQQARTPASQPPEGMVVVPELPTPMMLKAGGLVLHRDEDCQMDEDPYRERGQAAHCWIEMLAARPKGGE